MIKEVEKFVLNAQAKALATVGADGVNVVPVSTVRCVDGEVWLFDYFMNRTSENVKANAGVSLACWSGMMGYQLKGKARYLADGEEYEKACEVVKRLHPERFLKGLIVIQVEDVFSVGPGDSSLVNLI